MSNRPRQHHYVPKFYLAGFTRSGTADGELYVLDQSRANGWTISPTNAAKQRDYYAVDVGPEVDPNIMEQQILSPLEGDFSRVIRTIAEQERLPPRNDVCVFSDFALFLNFVAIMVARVPRTRTLVNNLAEIYVKQLLRETLSTPEGWERFKQDVRALGHQVGDDEYEKYRQLAMGEEYQVDLDRTSHVLMMEKIVDDLLPALAIRNWSLGIVHPDAPDLICSDVPVGITPTKRADLTQPILPDSPHTHVTIPITRRLAALGHFEDIPPVFRITEKGVAIWNSVTALEATQLFAPGPDFLIGTDQTICRGSELLRLLQKRKQLETAEADEEFNRLLAELGIESKSPPLPTDFSRADMYSDHN